jgi:hypothetical protein
MPVGSSIQRWKPPLQKNTGIEFVRNFILLLHPGKHVLYFDVTNHLNVPLQKMTRVVKQLLSIQHNESMPLDFDINASIQIKNSGY